MKNLYLVSQDINRKSNTYDSFVVCCDTEAEARATHPEGYVASDFTDGDYDENGCILYWRGRSWVDRNDLDKVKVRALGKALESEPYGIVCFSYNDL